MESRRLKSLVSGMVSGLEHNKKEGMVLITRMIVFINTNDNAYNENTFRRAWY